MATEIGLDQIAITAGSGVLMGGILGYAAKKLLKLAVILAVLEVGVLRFLEQKGVLDVYWEELGGLLPGSGGSGKGVESGMSGLASLIGALPIGASFIGGFLLGFRKG